MTKIPADKIRVAKSPEVQQTDFLNNKELKFPASFLVSRLQKCIKFNISLKSNIRKLI